jgi:hypothetical protein
MVAMILAGLFVGEHLLLLIKKNDNNNKKKAIKIVIIIVCAAGIVTSFYCSMLENYCSAFFVFIPAVILNSNK